jgi:MFS family permease
MSDLIFKQRLHLILRALRYRNYRLFFIGQGISLIGTWMQQIALSWLVYRLTNSPLLLGVIGFSSQIPVFIFSPIAGVYADRWNRYRLLIATQILAMLQASVLALLVLSGHTNIWPLILLSFFLGIINAFDIPIRQSFVVEMLDRKEDLPNAIALNSFLFNGARLIGPTIAGMIIAFAGEGICFLINAVSYLAVIPALLAMKIPRGNTGAAAAKLREGLTEGYRYIRNSIPIRYILIQLALISFMGMPYFVLLPVFAKDILAGGPGTLGFLVGSSGMGALTGALFLASRKSVVGLENLIAFASGFFGVGIIIFSLSTMLSLSAVMMFVSGFGIMVQMASSNTILQTIVKEDMRGRIMSLFAVAFIGVAPFGSLFAGSMASYIGAPATLVAAGTCCVLGAILFYRKLPDIRKAICPIYRDMGIAPSPPETPQV